MTGSSPAQVFGSWKGWTSAKSSILDFGPGILDPSRHDRWRLRIGRLRWGQGRASTGKGRLATCSGRGGAGHVGELTQSPSNGERDCGQDRNHGETPQSSHETDCLSVPPKGVGKYQR